jgi:hypothetical protein
MQPDSSLPPLWLASHLSPPQAISVQSEPSHTIHCNSISLQCGSPSIFVSKFCAYFSYPQCVPHALSISSSLSFMRWPKEQSVKPFIHWASYPAANLEHFNRLPFLLSSIIAAILLCCSAKCNVVQSKHNNVFNTVQLATCFSYGNHHQADVSKHWHDMFSVYSMRYHIVSYLQYYFERRWCIIRIPSAHVPLTRLSPTHSVMCAWRISFYAHSGVSEDTHISEYSASVGSFSHHCLLNVVHPFSWLLSVKW